MKNVLSSIWNLIDKNDSKEFNKIGKNGIKFRKVDDTGIQINIDDVNVALDSWFPKADIVFISHGHSDHICSSFFKSDNESSNERVNYNQNLICSKITKEIIEKISRKKIRIKEEKWILGNNLKNFQNMKYKNINIELIENGHAPGSLALFINGLSSIFFTGDFISEDRVLEDGTIISNGLKPRKCDYLIIDCTFASLFYSFPRFEENLRSLRRFMSKQFENGNGVIILAYKYGKSQEILKILDDEHPIFLENSVAKITRIISDNGVEFPSWKPYSSTNKNKILEQGPFVLILPPHLIYSDPYSQIAASERVKVVLPSGKVLNPSFRTEFPNCDLYLPLSDHCGFKELCDFVDACDPNTIILHSGRVEEFYYYLSKKYKNKDINVL